MAATPKFAHVVFRTQQSEAMRDWWCTLLDGHVVYTDEALSFITYDDEHHRVALLHPPVPVDGPKTPNTAAMHHVAYTFENIDDLLDRYVFLRDRGIVPAVCIAHGVTTSLYYKDPDGNFAEMQIDRFAEPDDATDYMMNSPEYSADSVGPTFDPELLLKARKAGATPEELQDRAWALQQDLPPAMPVLLASS